MPIWRLIAVDFRDPNWEASFHRGSVVARAPGESTAREAAQAAFGVQTRFPSTKGLRVPPWMRVELVRADNINSPLYSADGPTEVLQPTFSEAR
jgi:hypothetical protein